MSGLKRISISIPAELSDDLDYLSKRLEVSRSGLVSQMLLSAELGKLRALLEAIPQQPSEGDIKRFRGDSRSVIEDQLQRLQSLQGGLFDDTSR